MLTGSQRDQPLYEFEFEFLHPYNFMKYLCILKYFAVLKVLKPYGATAVDDVPYSLIMAKYKNVPHRGKGRFCHYRRISFLIIKRLHYF